jgi:acyl dehydratase
MMSAKMTARLIAEDFGLSLGSATTTAVRPVGLPDALRAE